MKAWRARAIEQKTIVRYDHKNQARPQGQSGTWSSAIPPERGSAPLVGNGHLAHEALWLAPFDGMQEALVKHQRLGGQVGIVNELQQPVRREAGLSDAPAFVYCSTAAWTVCRTGDRQPTCREGAAT